MLRVYKDFLHRVLVVLLYYREIGHDYKEAHIYVRDRMYVEGNGQMGPKVHEALRFFDEQYVVGDMSLNDLIDQICAQLTSREPEADRDLIDTIVRVLNLPYCQNTIANSSITRLRNAILIPDEIVNLKATLERELYCGSCSHKFMSGEMSTITRGDGHGVTVSCTRCIRPVYIADDTDHTKSIRIKDIKGLHTSLTRKHVHGNAPAAENIAELAGEILLAEGPLPRADQYVQAQAAPMGRPLWIFPPNDPPAERNPDEPR